MPITIIVRLAMRRVRSSPILRDSKVPRLPPATPTPSIKTEEASQKKKRKRTIPAVSGRVIAKISAASKGPQGRIPVRIPR